MLFAFAEFERDLIVERTQEGKRIARQQPDFREGRPRKFSGVQLDHAMSLLENYSFAQVTKRTGISMSTLKRESRKRRNKKTT